MLFPGTVGKVAGDEIVDDITGVVAGPVRPSGWRMVLRRQHKLTNRYLNVLEMKLVDFG